jgi:hypothetical protein
MKSQTLAFLINMLASASITGVAGADLCLGSCGTNANGNKECTFNVKIDLHASEFGYFYFEECEGTNPTLGKFTSCYTVLEWRSCRNVSPSNISSIGWYLFVLLRSRRVTTTSVLLLFTTLQPSNTMKVS